MAGLTVCGVWCQAACGGGWFGGAPCGAKFLVGAPLGLMVGRAALGGRRGGLPLLPGLPLVEGSPRLDEGSSRFAVSAAAEEEGVVAREGDAHTQADVVAQLGVGAAPLAGECLRHGLLRRYRLSSGHAVDGVD